MKKIDFQTLLELNLQVTVLGREDLKYILGAGEGYDSIGGENPGDECLISTCNTNDDCSALPYCTKCFGYDGSTNSGTCASWA